ncbi:MAG TPA: PaaI family thioesterase [Thermoanaerobaculia bacterium]|nr:PaaI family thioesterase [Thermoanaerobaculia bacterium]
MHVDEEHFRKLERLYQGAPINQYFRPTLKVSNGAAELSIPVRPEFFHAAHAVHGSIYFKALDDAAFFAVNSLVTDVFVLTASYNLYLTRPVTEGTLRAAGRVVHRSRNLFIAEAELLDDQARQVGRGSGTFMRSAIALTPEVGYE